MPPDVRQKTAGGVHHELIAFRTQEEGGQLKQSYSEHIQRLWILRIVRLSTCAN